MLKETPLMHKGSFLGKLKVDREFNGFRSGVSGGILIQEAPNKEPPKNYHENS